MSLVNSSPYIVASSETLLEGSRPLSGQQKAALESLGKASSSGDGQVSFSVVLEGDKSPTAFRGTFSNSSGQNVLQIRPQDSSRKEYIDASAAGRLTLIQPPSIYSGGFSDSEVITVLTAAIEALRKGATATVAVPRLPNTAPWSSGGTVAPTVPEVQDRAEPALTKAGERSAQRLFDAVKALQTTVPYQGTVRFKGAGGENLEARVNYMRSKYDVTLTDLDGKTVGNFRSSYINIPEELTFKGVADLVNENVDLIDRAAAALRRAKPKAP